MTRIKSALILVIGLALAGCYPPTTTRPVGTSSGLKPDPALTGTWKGKSDDGQPGYFHFLAQTDGAFTVVIVSGGPKSSDWNVATATSARVGDTTILNARLLSSNGKPETGAPAGTIPVLYRIDRRGTLTLAFLDEEKVKAAIKAGTMRGTIGKGQFGDATITADARWLDAYFATPAARAMFAKPFFVLRKVD